VNREEAMKALIESGMELRRDDIELGKQLERERIIKLLEDPNTLGAWWSNPEANIGLYGNLKNFVIALIKGEQK